MTAKPARIQYIESIRGIAAFVVVFAHVITAFDTPFVTGSLPSLAGENPAVRALGKIAFWPLGMGRLPVAIFFVLSGMALSQGFLRGGGQGYLQSAAIRRYVRLMIPSLASVLFAFCLLQAGLMHNHAAADLIQSEGGQAPWFHVTYTEAGTLEGAVREGMWDAFLWDQSEAPAGRLNSVLWTMRPELIGSFVVFAFLALFGRHGNRAGLAFAISGCLALAGFTLLALFPIGVGLAILRHNAPSMRLNTVSAVALLLIGLWLGGLYDYTNNWKMQIPITHSVLKSADAAPCLGAVLTVLALMFTPAFRAVLERQPFLWLGKISFGLYLCHVPILMSVGCWAYVETRAAGSAHGPAILAALSAVVPLSLLGGWILYHVADKPAVLLGKALANRVLAERTETLANTTEVTEFRPTGTPPVGSAA